MKRIRKRLATEMRSLRGTNAPTVIKRLNPIDNTSLRLHKAQDGRCPICRGSLLAIDDQPQTPLAWERWLASDRKMITITRSPGTSGMAELRLTHTQCRLGRHHAAHGTNPELLPAKEPTGLA